MNAIESRAEAFDQRPCAITGDVGVLELILGGARSGKSRLAEQLAADSGLDCVYIATAQAGDAEMAARIQRHRSARDRRWRTVEEPVQLARTLAAHAADDRCVLVDCLTLWLTNLLLAEDAAVFAREREALFAVLADLRGHVIFVSNEVGQGIVPMAALSRRFIDESGWLHQELARDCQRVLWVMAGLPQVLKGQL
jgi:adenosylcobinamide kinase/adenosylcobinamide-phosphate guanylyltransferase